MVTFLVFIFILSILIVVHEFGHFLAAKQAGVRVEKFAIGFGPPLLKINGKETQFLICLFPLGGYVKLAGDTRSGCQGFSHEFLSKPVGIKMRIVFVGPLFNYLLAFILFWGMGLIGFPHLDTVVGGVLEGYPAYQAGLKEGDKILEVGGRRVEYWAEMAKVIHEASEKTSLKIEREGKIILLDISLKEKEVVDELGAKRNVSLIGIFASEKVKIIKYNFFKAFLKGGEALFNLTTLIGKGFIAMIFRKVSVKDAVTGPIGIYYITSQAVRMGIIAILHLMAVLSTSLAVVNLFPLPVLDGGHLLIFFIEKIRKRSLSEKTEDFLTRAGLTFIGLLAIFIFYNDIVKFGFKIWEK
ncbi:MAG: RIP metalloprotease RseP [Candidatus Omnitrophica bacterium]|nr:RIP metalloprotease RseP [Candidatus Omnitrophota bacterium]MBU1811296.1 RIP metalloprotease RseP [Candidatus Omnitrophota bacterium]